MNKYNDDGIKAQIKKKKQCFCVENNNLVLKKTHSYYFQVQLQLLITEASFCDFVLYAKEGLSSIEMIFPDTDLQKHIVCCTRLFWEKFSFPRIFS